LIFGYFWYDFDLGFDLVLISILQLKICVI